MLGIYKERNSLNNKQNKRRNRNRKTELINKKDKDKHNSTKNNSRNLPNKKKTSLLSNSSFLQIKTAIEITNLLNVLHKMIRVLLYRLTRLSYKKDLILPYQNNFSVNSGNVTIHPFHNTKIKNYKKSRRKFIKCHMK